MCLITFKRNLETEESFLIQLVISFKSYYRFEFCEQLFFQAKIYPNWKK